MLSHSRPINGGNGETLTTLVRLVAPFAVGMPEPRSSVLAYMEEK